MKYFCTCSKELTRHLDDNTIIKERYPYNDELWRQLDNGTMEKYHGSQNWRQEIPTKPLYEDIWNYHEIVFAIDENGCS